IMRRVDCLIITSGNEKTPSTRIRILDVVQFFSETSATIILHKDRRRCVTLISLLKCRSILFQKVFPNFLILTVLKVFGKKIFFDIDDAIYLKFNRKKKERFHRFLAACTTVFCGNQYLADYVNHHNSNTAIIPTAVD